MKFDGKILKFLKITLKFNFMLNYQKKSLVKDRTNQISIIFINLTKNSPI